LALCLRGNLDNVWPDPDRTFSLADRTGDPVKARGLISGGFAALGACVFTVIAETLSPAMNTFHDLADFPVSAHFDT
jgi:hypothetical protein